MKRTRGIRTSSLLFVVALALVAVSVAGCGSAPRHDTGLGDPHKKGTAAYRDAKMYQQHERAAPRTAKAAH